MERYAGLEEVAEKVISKGLRPRYSTSTERTYTLLYFRRTDPLTFMLSKIQAGVSIVKCSC